MDLLIGPKQRLSAWAFSPDISDAGCDDGEIGSGFKTVARCFPNRQHRLAVRSVSDPPHLSGF